MKTPEQLLPTNQYEPFDVKIERLSTNYKMNISLTNGGQQELSHFKGTNITIVEDFSIWTEESMDKGVFEDKQAEKIVIKGNLSSFDETGIYIEQQTNSDEQKPMIRIPFYERQFRYQNFVMERRIQGAVTDGGRDLLFSVWQHSPLTPWEAENIVREGYNNMLPDDRDPSTVISRHPRGSNIALWEMAMLNGQASQLIDKRIKKLANAAF